MKTAFKTILVFIATAIATWCVWTLLAFQIVIEDNAGISPLLPGDHVLVSRVTYGLQRPVNALFGKKDTCNILPAKGELLAFYDPVESLHAYSGKNVCIGECTALPGDTIWLQWKSPYDTLQTPTQQQPFIVPGKNLPVEIKPWNIALFSNALHTHEHANVCYESDSILIVNGKPTHYMTFAKDYIWIGNPSDTSGYGSGTFGFMPCNLLIGRLLCTTYSRDDSKSFMYSFRTERFFTSIRKLQQNK